MGTGLQREALGDPVVSGPTPLLEELRLRIADGPREGVDPCLPAKAQSQLNVDVPAGP